MLIGGPPLDDGQLKCSLAKRTVDSKRKSLLLVLDNAIHGENFSQIILLIEDLFDEWLDGWMDGWMDGLLIRSDPHSSGIEGVETVREFFQFFFFVSSIASSALK